ncbi:MAG: family 1 glycosylhydrolase [Caldilineaceae bacterium]|nr:family 1 glycosylhydrolase [Caldilineaceae bacterium]
MYKSFFSPVRLFILFAFLLSAFWGGVRSVSPLAAQETAQATIPVANTAYLPIVEYGRWPALKIAADFGHMTTLPDVMETDYPLVQELGGDWIRVWLSWAEIETAPGEYNWSVYDGVINRMAELGIEPLVLIYNIPAWAAANPCGPITNNDAVTSFAAALVDRYDDLVDAWEFLNEPDSFEPHPYGAYIGCWGNYGSEYAASLTAFYMAVKTRQPSDLVFFGGLAYDNWSVFNRAFFADALAAGAGDYFDGLSFHFYPINAEDFPSVRDKTEELRATMAEYGVTGKRMWITETSMWANDPNLGLEGQREFIVKEWTRAACAGVDNLFWFAIRDDPAYEETFERWLIDADHNFANAYDTFQHYAGRVKGGYCFGSMAGQPDNLEAYQFDTDAGPVIIAWSTADESAALTFEADGPRMLLDREGNLIETLTPVDGTISVTIDAQAKFIVDSAE